MRTYSMYLSPKDCDLLLLYQLKRFPSALRIALKRYLTEDPSLHIELPEQLIPMTYQQKNIKLYLYPERGEQEFVEFLDSIPKNNFNIVVKLLIRNAYELPDIRQLMTEGKVFVQRPQNDQTEKKTEKREINIERKKKIETEVGLPPAQTTTNKPAAFNQIDEDDIFAGI